MRRLHAFLVALLIAVGSAMASECTIVFAEAGLATGDITTQGPIAIGDDLQLTFDQGSAMSAPSLSSAGRVTLTMGAALTITGTTDAVSITRIDMVANKASNTFSTGAATCLPEGTFTIDKTTYTSTWELAEGSNSVVITNTMGAPQIKEITVTYTIDETGEEPGGEATLSETSLVFAEAGLTANTSVVEQSPIAVGDDIQLSFGKGSAMADPKINSTGRITLSMGATLTVTGTTDDVRIIRIDLISPKASQTFSEGAASCQPEGTFTIDKTNFISTWELAEGANSVVITSTMGAPVFTEIRVTYLGGKGSGNTGGEEPPVEPDPTVTGDNAFSTTFATPEEFAALTVVNVDESSNTWRYDRNKQLAYIMNDMGNTVGKNDYLVSPALQLYAGHTYRISFTAWCENPAYPERIAAYVGTAPTADALTTEIVAPTIIASRTPARYSGEFTPEADGTYYAALHACSDPGMFYLYANEFTVSRAVTPQSPAEIADLKVVPAADGSLKAELSMTTPSTSVDGTPLAALDSVIITRDGAVIATLPAAPGRALTLTDAVDAAGSHTYAATAVAPTGKSFDAVATAWIGLAAPADPTALTVVETAPGVLTFSWDAVTTNIHGHAVDPSVVTYTIYANGTANVVADNLTGTTAELTLLEPGDPQAISYFVLKAATAAGTSASGAESATIAYGTPYAMPWHEDFTEALPDGGHVDEIIADSTYKNTAWSYFNAMVNDDILP